MAAAGMLLGLLVRLLPLVHWMEHPERVFLDGAPCLTTFDGYEYLRKAEALASGHYTANDPLRGFPEKAVSRPYPSLLSMLTAILLRLLPVDPRWIASALPVLAGALLFPAVLLLVRQLAGTRVAVLAGWLAACSPAFAQRSELGRFDTDCMIPVFTLLAFYLANEVYAPHRRKITGVLFLLASLLNTVLFFLWWDNAPLFAIAVFLLAFFQARSISRLDAQQAKTITGLLVVFLLVAALGLVVLMGEERINVLMLGSWKLAGQFFSVMTDHVGHAFTHVAELERWTILELSARLGGHAAFGIASLAGFLAMIRTQRTQRATLLSLLLLAMLSLFGKRFAYFAVPVYSMGMAFLLGVLWDQACRCPIPARRTIHFLLAILFFTQIAMCGTFLHSNTTWPPLPPNVVAGMKEARTITPRDAVIWSWWDNGCAIMYYAQRATIEDNLFNTPERSAINALPLTLPDERTAANFMRFYAAHGLRGIARVLEETHSNDMKSLIEILSAPPENAAKTVEAAGLSPVQYWLDFLFPDASAHPPLFLFLDYLYLPTVPVWYASGMGDCPADRGRVPFVQYYYDVQVNGREIRVDSFAATTDSGILTHTNLQIQLGRLLIRHAKAVQEIDYHRSGLILEVDPVNGWAVLCDSPFHDGLFNQLFFYGRHQTPHFRRVWSKPPYGQLWRVTPESYGTNRESANRQPHSRAGRLPPY